MKNFVIFTNLLREQFDSLDLLAEQEISHKPTLATLTERGRKGSHFENMKKGLLSHKAIK